MKKESISNTTKSISEIVDTLEMLKNSGYDAFTISELHNYLKLLKNEK